MSRLPSWSRTIDISSGTEVSFPSVRVLPYNEITVLVDSDTDGKLTLEQGTDADVYEIIDERYVYANKVEDLTFTVQSEYAQLKYQNTGSTDTSGFKLRGYARDNGVSNIYNSLVNVLLSDAETLSAAGFTSSVNINNTKQIEVYGYADPSTNLTVQYSHNDVSFYDTIHSVAADGDYHMSFASGAKYLRLKNELIDTSLTAIVSGKY